MSDGDIVAVNVPSGCWGFDCDLKLSAGAARRMAAATYRGRPVRFVWRYVFFGEPSAGDIDGDEARAIVDAGLILLIVQHPRNPGWSASAARGAEDGLWAANNARAAGYPDGAYVALDLEGLANSGQEVIDHCEAWAESVKGAGYGRCLYVGFDCGLTSRQLFDLRGFDRYWSDAGGRAVDVRGVCCRQHATIALSGMQVDPDEHFADRLGGVLRGMSVGAAITRTDISLEDT